MWGILFENLPPPQPVINERSLRDQHAKKIFAKTSWCKFFFAYSSTPPPLQHLMVHPYNASYCSCGNRFICGPKSTHAAHALLPTHKPILLQLIQVPLFLI